MTVDIAFLDATELASRIKSGELTSVQVVQAHLDRITTIDPRINAIVTVNDDALADAQAADDALAAGEEVGPLHGVPFTVKDSIDTAGLLTQRGSPIFEGRTPDADAVAVARMKAAGGVLLAKTNLPEFSYSTESVNLLSGRTNNPWNTDRTSGGSSGGESAAIAAGLSPIGIGTDLAISVRGPASQTGIAAIKPTHGRIPMTGVWPRVPRRDWHVGPMARTIRDLELGYDIMRGPDGHDGFAVTPASVDAGSRDAAAAALRVAWFTDSGLGPVDPEVSDTVRQAAEALQAAGVHVEKIDIPTLQHDNPLALFNRQHVMELKPAMSDATKGHEDQRFIMSKAMLATPDTAVEDYVAAEQGFERIRDAYAEVFTRFDAVLLPVLPIPAHEHDKAEFVIDGQAVDATHIQAFTVQFNITGMPALSMRFGTSSDGMPIGVQVAGPWYAESTVFNVASLLESISPVRDQHPNI